MKSLLEPLSKDLSKPLLEERVSIISILSDDIPLVPEIKEVLKDVSLSNLGLFFNIIKSVLGVGFLGIAYSLHESGWFFIPIMVLISIITYYNSIKLNNFVNNFTIFDKYSDNHLTYYDLGGEIYGSKMKYFIQVIWGLEIFFVSVLLITLSMNLITNILDIQKNIFVLLGTIIFYYGLTFIKSYSKLQFLSAFGLLSVIFLFISLIYNLISDSVNDKIPEVTHQLFNVYNIPKSIGLTLFSFGGHVVFIEIFDSVKDKDSSRRTITYTWLILTIFTITFAVISFFLYGDSISQNIIDNVAESSLIKELLEIYIFINIIFTFPIMFTPLSSKFKNKYVPEFTIRFVIILSMCFVSYYWDSFLSIMIIIGAVFENMTSIILPPLLVLKYEKCNLGIIEKCFNIFILLFGVSILGFTIFDLF